MDLCFQVNTDHPTTRQTGRGLPLVCSVTPAEAASLCTKYYSLDEKERARVNLGTGCSSCVSCNIGDCSDCRGRTNFFTCHSLWERRRGCGGYLTPVGGSHLSGARRVSKDAVCASAFPPASLGGSARYFYKSHLRVYVHCTANLGCKFLDNKTIESFGCCSFQRNWGEGSGKTKKRREV